MKIMFSRIIFVILLVTSINFGQSLEDNNDAKILYNEGLSALKSGNFNGAIDKFDEALKLVDDYRLYYRKGEALRKQHKYDDAINNYTTSIRKNESYYPAYYYTASSYFAKKDYDNAIKYFELTLTKTDNKKVVKRVNKSLATCHKKLAYPILVEANKAKDKRNYNLAVQKFKKSIEIAPSDAAYIGLAEVYIQLGKYDEAIQAAQKSSEYKGKISKGAVYYYSGLGYKGKGQKDKAAELFNKGKKYKEYKKLCEYELKMMS